MVGHPGPVLILLASKDTSNRFLGSCKPLMLWTEEGYHEQ